MLLVLDNCEHLSAPAPGWPTTLLRAAPHLRLLATSREGLGVAGEQTYRVPSLAVPDPARLPPLEQLRHLRGGAPVRGAGRRHGAAGLRADGGERGRGGPDLRAAGGLPLAIELAAARVRVLSVEEIAARLDDRFRLLTGGPRTALPRQQTLRATVDWSYALWARRSGRCCGG